LNLPDFQETPGQHAGRFSFGRADREIWLDKNKSGPALSPDPVEELQERDAA